MLVDIESLFRITFVYRFRTMKSLGAGPISTFPFLWVKIVKIHMARNQKDVDGSFCLEVSVIFMLIMHPDYMRTLLDT